MGVQIALGVVGAVIVLLAAVLAWQVDDWSRDLTQNTAATRPDHSDERLRPLALERPIDEAAAAVRAAASGLYRWRLVEEETIDGAQRLHYVRTTPLMWFKDDIWVSIGPDGQQSIVNVESKSRVGKGDLGQNPRNIKELLDAVRNGAE